MNPHPLQPFASCVYPRPAVGLFAGAREVRVANAPCLSPDCPACRRVPEAQHLLALEFLKEEAAGDR